VKLIYDNTHVIKVPVLYTKFHQYLSIQKDMQEFI